jgi:hypothetical protein
MRNSFGYFIFFLFILFLQISIIDSYIKDGSSYNYPKINNNRRINKGKQYDLCFLISMPILLFIFLLKYLYYRILYNEI